MWLIKIAAWKITVGTKALINHGRNNCETNGFRKNMVIAFQFAFWLGMMLFLLGSLISFIPGAETDWFIITAGLVGMGFFVSSKYYRIAAIVTVAICVFWAYAGYSLGVEHKTKSHWQSVHAKKEIS
jgi:hypothetical protein